MTESSASRSKETAGASPASPDASRDLGAVRALILQGGGAKGLAFVGAIEVLVERGASFDVFVGTSAGAITAAFLAAEMTPRQLEEVARHDFQDLLDNRANGFFRYCSALFRGWIHSGEALRKWLNHEILDHWKRKYRQPNRQVPLRLGELKHRLIAIAVGKRQGHRVFDSHAAERQEALGALHVADIAYGSAAIPLFFKPVYLPDEHYDGGVLNNFPVDVYVATVPDAPFLALHLTEQPVRSRFPLWLARLGLFAVLGDVISIQLKQREPQLLQKYAERIVQIDPSPIGTLDFSLSQQEKKMLRAAGRFAALRHLAHYFPSSNVSASDLATAHDDLSVARAKVLEARLVRDQARRRGRSFISGVAFAAAVVACILLFATGKVTGVPVRLGLSASITDVGQAATDTPNPDAGRDPASMVGPAIVVGSTTFINYLMCIGFNWDRPDIVPIDTGSEAGKDVLRKAYLGGIQHNAQHGPILAVASEPLEWCECDPVPPYYRPDTACGASCLDPDRDPGYYRVTISDRAFHAVRIVDDAIATEEAAFADLTRSVVPEPFDVRSDGRRCVDVRLPPDSRSPEAKLPCISRERLVELIARAPASPDGGTSRAPRTPPLALWVPAGTSGTRRQIQQIGEDVLKRSWQWREESHAWNLRLGSIDLMPALAIGSEASVDGASIDGGLRNSRMCLNWGETQAANRFIRTYRVCSVTSDDPNVCKVLERRYYLYGRLPQSAGFPCKGGTALASEHMCQLPARECDVVNAMLQIASQAEGPGSAPAAQLKELGSKCQFERPSPRGVVDLRALSSPH